MFPHQVRTPRSPNPSSQGTEELCGVPLFFFHGFAQKALSKSPIEKQFRHTQGNTRPPYVLAFFCLFSAPPSHLALAKIGIYFDPSLRFDKCNLVFSSSSSLNMFRSSVSRIALRSPTLIPRITTTTAQNNIGFIASRAAFSTNSIKMGVHNVAK